MNEKTITDTETIVNIAGEAAHFVIDKLGEKEILNRYHIIMVASLISDILIKSDDMVGGD